MRIVSLLLAVVMIVGMCVGVNAAPVSRMLESTHIVNVVGELEEADGNYVTLILRDAEKNVKHIDQVSVNQDGTYRAKFMFDGSAAEISNLTLSVKQGNEDVTDSVISALAEKEAIVYEMNVVNTAEATIINAAIENYFDVEDKTYVIMTAYYDESSKLVDVCVGDTNSIDFGENKKSIIQEIPDSAKKVKVFMWDSVKTMIPLMKEVSGKKNETITVLAIGNSFSYDSLEYLAAIAANDGVTIKARHAMIGGSSFDTHWNAWSATGDDRKKYTESGVACDIDHFLDDGTVYDYITIQQVSGKSGLIETYDENADNMLKYIREKQPAAEIVLHSTWAYEVGSTHPSFGNYNKDQGTMHKAIKEAVTAYCEYAATLTTDDGTPISLNGKPLRYIPTGEAFYNARQSEMFNTTYIYIKIARSMWTAIRKLIQHRYAHFTATVTTQVIITEDILLH